MVDNLTPEQRRHTMSRIRSHDTAIELIVRRALHKRGHRFRVNVSWLEGKPDIVFTKVRLAIFIDGDFWHGWKFSEWAAKLAPYWEKKITGNMGRDLARTLALRQAGWSVLRIWEHEVESDLDRCILRIERRVTRLRKTRSKAPLPISSKQD